MYKLIYRIESSLIHCLRLTNVEQPKYLGVQPIIYPTTFFKYIEIKFLLFLHVFSFISNEFDKIKFFKKTVVGYIFGWTPEYFSCLGYIFS